MGLYSNGKADAEAFADRHGIDAAAEEGHKLAVTRDVSVDYVGGWNVRVRQLAREADRRDIYEA